MQSSFVRTVDNFALLHCPCSMNPSILLFVVFQSRLARFLDTSEKIADGCQGNCISPRPRVPPIHMPEMHFHTFFYSVISNQQDDLRSSKVLVPRRVSGIKYPARFSSVNFQAKFRRVEWLTGVQLSQVRSEFPSRIGYCHFPSLSGPSASPFSRINRKYG